MPYGVYDMIANAGFVSVGITSDTAEFAVWSIRCWLERMGRKRYPHARELMAGGCGLQPRTAKAGRRDRPRDPRSPLSARHIEVEQDRAPAGFWKPYRCHRSHGHVLALSSGDGITAGIDGFNEVGGGDATVGAVRDRASSAS